MFYVYLSVVVINFRMYVSFRTHFVIHVLIITCLLANKIIITRVHIIMIYTEFNSVAYIHRNKKVWMFKFSISYCAHTLVIHVHCPTSS